MDPLKAVKLINLGKQVGARLDTTGDSILYYNTVGVQKWKDGYRVHVSKIADANMAGEYFEINEVLEFKTLDEAFEYIQAESPVRVESLDICKGQKIFEPQYIYAEGKLRDYKEPRLDENEF